MPVIIPTPQLPAPHGAGWRVLPLASALAALEHNKLIFISLFTLIDQAVAVQFFVNDKWTNWVPLFGELSSAYFQLLMVSILFDGNGKLKIRRIGHSDIETNFTFMLQTQVLMDALTLEQKKKRKWGLFIPTKHRNSRHRGPKRDRLCLRVPHR